MGQMGVLGVSNLDPTPCGYSLGQYQLLQDIKSQYEKYHHRCICNEVNEINKGKKRQLRCMTDNKLFCDKSIELLS